MRTVAIIISISLFCVNAFSQDQKDNDIVTILKSEGAEILDDSCGNPLEFSQTWDKRHRQITKILDGNTVLFDELQEKKTQ